MYLTITRIHCVDISVLQRCIVTSPSPNTIEVSCELLQAYQRIRVTVSNNGCTCSPPVTVIGDNPITVFNLTAEVYTVEVTVVSNNDVSIENKNIITMITVSNTSPATDESGMYIAIATYVCMYKYIVL